MQFFHINVLFLSPNISSPQSRPSFMDSSFPLLSARAATVKIQRGATAHFSGNGGHDACLLCINLNQYSPSWKHKHLKGQQIWITTASEDQTLTQGCDEANKRNRLVIAFQDISPYLIHTYPLNTHKTFMDLSAMNLPDYNCPAVSLVVFRLGPGNRDETSRTWPKDSVLRSIEEVFGFWNGWRRIHRQIFPQVSLMTWSWLKTPRGWLKQVGTGTFCWYSFLSVLKLALCVFLPLSRLGTP